MPVAAKSLHMAANLDELKKVSAVDKLKLTNVKSVDMLTGAVSKLLTSAKSILTKEGEEKDEEMIYVYLYRAMEIWQIIMTTDNYKKDTKFYKLMYGKEITEIMNLLDEYTNKLVQRYKDNKSNTMQNSNDYSGVSSFKMENVLSLKKKKRKEAGDVIASANGFDSISSDKGDQISLGDFTLEFNNDFNEQLAQEGYYSDKKFIQCKELKELYFCTPKEVLILDIRPRNDFNLSQISGAHCINIPETLITPGLSANKLALLVGDEDQKIKWKLRDQYKQVVLMDWSSEEKDVIPTCSLHNLLNILLKWDPSTIYANKPLILNGGYEGWLDMYPTLSTNANVKRPEKKIASPFIHLSDHVIEYPMRELEEITTPKPKPVPLPTEKAAPKVASSTPAVDRTTKPEISKDKSGKLPPQLDHENANNMEIEAAKLSSAVEYEPMDEDMGPGGKIARGRDLSPSDVKVKEGPKTESSNPVRPQKAPQTPQPNASPPLSRPYPTTPPVRPTTPTREERRVFSTSSRKDVGDGDSTTYLDKLKFDNATPRGGGLKRSSSSPNINKLADEEPQGTKHFTPTFDRSMKPKPFSSSYESYSPRDGNADIMYSASNKEGRGLTGLKNFGNVCYMNSIMQCISNTVELTNALTRFNAKETAGKRQIAIEVSSLLRNVWSGDTRLTSCRNLKNRVGALKQAFAGCDQQDSHEFLTILMDWLHEDLNEPSNIRSLQGADEATGEKAWGEFKRKNDSIVVNLFYGQQRSAVTCQHCQKQSVSFEPFSNLTIPLPSPQETSYEKYSIEDCLRLYLKGETINGWVCPNCKTARDATKKLDITRLPPILIIHLKRFTNEGFCRKRISLVEFPINDFDMAPFTHPSSELRFHSYNLYAVSNHIGTMNTGHYTAFCKNHVLGKWYKFDDQDVSEISPSDVRSSAAYILFYESSHLHNQRVME